MMKMRPMMKEEVWAWELLRQEPHRRDQYCPCSIFADASIEWVQGRG